MQQQRNMPVLPPPSAAPALPAAASTPRADAATPNAGLPPTDEHSSPRVSLRDVLGDVDAGLSRITTHQLQNADAAQQGGVFVFLELPIRAGDAIDTVAIEIEGGGSDSDGAGEDQLELNLEVPVDDGTLRARLGLAGKRLALTVWSESAPLRELIAANLGELDAGLQRHGFDLAPIMLREVPPPDPLRRRPHGLVDTEV